MNTLCTPRGYSSQLAVSGRRRLIAIGLLNLALAACGGDGGMVATSSGDGSNTPAGGTSDPPPSTGGSTDGAPVLDCVRENFPCRFDEVPLPIIERSLALSDDVARQLVDGIAIEEVAAFLSAQSDIADVTVDGPVLGFRLAGGRPMIVDVTGDQEFLGAAPAAGAPVSVDAAVSMMKQTIGPRRLSTVRTVLTQKLAGGDNVERHGLVLSPLRYEENFGNAGELVAEALSTIPGFEGNVTYLATTDEHDPQVTVDILTLLEDFDVIHIDTHGGTICKKEPSATSNLTNGTGKQICENGITDFLVQRFHGTADDLLSISHPGIIHYRGRLHQSIAVTADFFRHYYPEGLADKLFILGSCNTFRSDLADAIAGEEGIFVSWDGYTEYSLVRNTSLSLLDSLGLGLTVGEAYARVPTFTPENPEAQGALQQTGRRWGGDLRIRDLLAVRDNLTGKLLTDNSGIEVNGVPGDGQNDNLDLEFTVDGITPEQLGNFYVNLVINDAVIGHLNLQQSGVQLSDYRYRVTTPVPLPFDVQEGEALNMDFWIPLPDLGEDHFYASPKVAEQDAGPDVGSEWMLTSRLTWSGIDNDTVKEATVVFALEPDDNPDSRFHYFRVQSGSVHVQRDYEDALGCHFSVDHTVDIPAGAANNYLKFDVGSQTIIVEGFGSLPAQTVQTTGSCGDSANVNVGGVYFLADPTPVSGDSAQGSYNDGAARPTIIEWTVSRTR